MVHLSNGASVYGPLYSVHPGPSTVSETQFRMLNITIQQLKLFEDTSQATFQTSFFKVSVKENEVPTEKNSTRASIFATKASYISN